MDIERDEFINIISNNNMIIFFSQNVIKKLRQRVV